MTWFSVGAAATTAVVGLVSANSAQNAGTRNANAVSKAEGEAIVKERLNATIRNSYNVALDKAQLALQKRQLSGQTNAAGIIGLQAHANADVASAGTNSIGASVDAVKSDIDQKITTAIDMTTDQFEQSIDNFNTSLDMMVLNTEVSSPTVRAVNDQTQSTGSLLSSAVLGGLAQFASSYAMRSMKLGIGTPKT